MRNAERVRRAYEAWNRDDFDAFRPYLHPDVEWHSSGMFPGFEPVYRGHEGVREWWYQLKEPWESFTIEVRQEFERGATLVTDVRFRALGTPFSLEDRAGRALPLVRLAGAGARRVGDGRRGRRDPALGTNSIDLASTTWRKLRASAE